VSPTALEGPEQQDRVKFTTIAEAVPPDSSGPAAEPVETACAGCTSAKKRETGRAPKARTISRARIPTQAESWRDTKGGWCRRSAGARIAEHTRMIYRREIRFRHCHSNGVDHVQVSSNYGDSHRARRCSSGICGVRPGRARKGGDPRSGAGYGSFDAVASAGRASSAETLRSAAGAGAQPGGGRGPRRHQREAAHMPRLLTAARSVRQVS
jgi:hypothetical protein